MALIDGDELYNNLAYKLEWLMQYGDDVYISVGDCIRDTIYNQEIDYNIEVIEQGVREIGMRYCVSVNCDNNCDCCEHSSLMKGILQVIKNGGIKVEQSKNT